ncbi:Rap guanine nucleotide exchange factor 1 [Dermatophagoides pteronyssinus]|uniref:Rap guanine nucleotide exchange factor 1 n=1 Tax=Dermatophagoides pteronyssinus TaxID=6956 RepID=A0ABQ8IZL9_DERPT|nr:Rap guanine nucleotide exchange factor 1 [Dermatophagoides pteronyssinus]
MAKTPKNESSLASSSSSSVSSTVAMSTMATAGLAFITNGGNSNAAASPPAKNRKVPFKKVFSSSQLTTNNNNNNQQQQQQKSRCSICSVNSSFQLLNRESSHLSSSLPGMYEKIANDDQRQFLTITSQKNDDHSHQHEQNVLTKPKAVIPASTSNKSENGHLLNAIPIAAIEPSLIGSLASYLADLRHFNAEKYCKEIELMLKYFEDSVKKDKLELLNGSCNILIETISLNCARLRDAYLHLQQVQLRLQILCMIHMEDNGDTNSARKRTSPIIEATNELYKNLSDLVKWSDEIYLRQQVRHFYHSDMDPSQWNMVDHINECDEPIPRQLIDDGSRISRLVFNSFKNLVKAYRNLECELRKCYQDYLYNNSKLADYIMADAINQRRNEDETSLDFQETIQKAMRRRSVTPPPEYDRIELSNYNNNHPHQSIRTMVNGSTSTIASLLSSNSSHSATTNSSTSSTSPSSIFRTHRFIPNIISHQAQKMAQHFELKKFRSNAQHGSKKDSLPRQQDKGSQQQLSENQTMLSFLFSLSNSSSSSLKRSESASNIHRINTNILLPKHLLQMSTEPSSPSSNRSPTADRHLSPQQQSRKHSINESIPTHTSHQHYDRPVPTLKQIIDSKSFDIDQHLSDETSCLSQCRKSSNSPKKHDSKIDSTPPPPLPPKTYNRCSNSTTTTSPSSSMNNSGRSSIASNISSMSSSSSLNIGKDTNLRNGNSRMKDCDSGFGSSTPAMPSTLYQQPIEKLDSIDLGNRNSATNPTIVKTKETVITVDNKQDTGFSQVTLRSKKNAHRNRTRTIQDSVADDENKGCATSSSSHTIVGTDGNNEDERCSSYSPPPLPAPDSFLCSIIEPHDVFKNKNIEEEKENLMNICPNQNVGTSPTSEFCCCCSNRSMIRTYRKPGTNLRPLSIHQPLTKSFSLAANHSSKNRHFCSQANSCCCCQIQTDESLRQQSLPRRPSLSLHETPSLSPPPLPPKRNLHAYMGMVGNYHSPTGEHSGHTFLRATKSMFCEKPSQIKSHHISQTSTSSSVVSSNSSISTATTGSSFSSITGKSSQPHDTSFKISNVDPTDQYEHLPMAPSPPPESAPSPPPNLPPRRGQIILSRSTDSNLSTKRLNVIASDDLVQPHFHHHHHHHGYSFHHFHETSSTDSTASNDKHEKPATNDQENATIKELDETSSDNDEDSVVDEICQYCSLGTKHSDDECILAQVDISSEMFTLETTNDSEGSTSQVAITAFELITADMIRGGQIDALIIKATQASMSSDDETFVDCFLSTYRSFISANDLLTKLTFRYRYFSGGQTSSSSSTSTNNSTTTDIIRQSVARKVVNFITLFIAKIYIYDFDKQLFQTMMEFIYQLVNKGDLVNAKFLREKCYEKLRIREREFRRQQQQQSQSNDSFDSQQQNDNNNNVGNVTSFKQTTAVNVNTFDIVHLKTWTLLDFKAEHLAEQMTLLDSRLFYKIEPPEILIWAKEQKEECIPNLSTFTEHFNNMSYWTRSQILKCQEQKEREKYMLKFIKIMKYLRKLNNFNSYLAILSALDCAPISRLDWPKNVTDMIREYGSLIDSSSSFRTYRNILANSKPPCIPYIGLILQDLTFVHIGNSDILPDGKINWCKHYKQYKILCQMAQFKQSQYSINENENIIAFFGNFQDFLPENVMWQISDSLKPRSINSSTSLSVKNLVPND